MATGRAGLIFLIPDRWLPADAQPSPAEVTHAHVADPTLSVEDIRQDQEESLRSRLA